MNNLDFQFLGFNIIHGIDGSYVVKDGKLIKIIKKEFSDDWCISTGGWMKIYLEDGTILQCGKDEK